MSPQNCICSKASSSCRHLKNVAKTDGQEKLVEVICGRDSDEWWMDGDQCLIRPNRHNSRCLHFALYHLLSDVQYCQFYISRYFFTLFCSMWRGNVMVRMLDLQQTAGFFTSHDNLTNCSHTYTHGGCIVRTLDLRLSAAGSNPGHDTAWLFLR